jgi:multidrug efflux pump subunit AcrA (membrane-fusion protein)
MKRDEKHRHQRRNSTRGAQDLTRPRRSPRREATPRFTFHVSRLLFLLLALLLTACGRSETANLGPTPTPLPTPVVPERPTYTVQQGTVVSALEFTGRVSPLVEQALFFKSAGFVDQVMVQRGDRVQAGDVLAQLEITGLQNQLAQAQVAVETAQIRLQQAEQDRQDALLEARINRDTIQLRLEGQQGAGSSAALVAAQIELENARERVAAAEIEVQESLEREWETEEARRRYQRELEAAEEALAIARARYNDALAAGGSAALNRQILEQELALAELRIEQLERGVDPLLELDVERAQLDVQRIETQIADAQLIAPVEGEVLSLSVRAGSRAEAFETAVVLAQPEALEVTAELGSEELNQLSVGQEATITLRNRPEEPFGGVVRQLPLAFGGGAGDADTRVRIHFDNPPTTLALGELATVRIVLEAKEDVLWLPPAAIRTFQGRTFVVIQEAGGQRRADVRLGIQSPARVEVVEGVEPGQTIIGE